MTWNAGGVEYIAMISPQYIADLGQLGRYRSRTTESQVHRELASVFPAPLDSRTEPMET